MNDPYVTPEDLTWTCGRCGGALSVGEVTVGYMGHRFTAKLPKCPRCGLILVSEEVAMGKMAEVEQILEDK